MFLGLDTNTHQFYESRGNWGARFLDPPPFIFYMQVATSPEEALAKLETNEHEHLNLLFREDQFDPVSVVRRGRVYKHEGGADWHVTPSNEWELQYEAKAKQKNLMLKKWVTVYQSYPMSVREPNGDLFVAIGNKHANSLWRVVSKDRMLEYDELITLRPLHLLGTLPAIIPELLPEKLRKEILKELERVRDDIHRASTKSIIDRCREAALLLLLKYHNSGDPVGAYKTDLSKLADRAMEDGKQLACWSAKILARLHARTKATEEHGRKTRPVNEYDAELAIHCLINILNELGYSKL